MRVSLCMQTNTGFFFFFFAYTVSGKKKKNFFFIFEILLCFFKFEMVAVCTIEEEIKRVNIMGSTPSSTRDPLPTVLQRAHISNCPLRF